MQILWLTSGLGLQGQVPGPPHAPWAWHYGMMGGGWGIFMMMISMVVFWGIIIGGILLLVRSIFPQSGSKSSEDSLEILKKRYVRGEIGKEEFESKKRDIIA
ncbi:MAG: SHOCT domain-containing protein [Candidatus Binatia bacterium]